MKIPLISQFWQWFIRVLATEILPYIVELLKNKENGHDGRKD